MLTQTTFHKLYCWCHDLVFHAEIVSFKFAVGLCLTCASAEVYSIDPRLKQDLSMTLHYICCFLCILRFPPLAINDIS
jgi:hypothetical protein